MSRLRISVCSEPGCPMLVEYGDWCDAHHPTRLLGILDPDDLTPEILYELVTGGSHGGGPREHLDDDLRLYWYRHRLAILDLLAGRFTIGSSRVERVWLSMVHRYGEPPKPVPLWGEGL